MANLSAVVLPLIQDQVDWPFEVQRLTYALLLYVVSYWSGRGAAWTMEPPGNPTKRKR